MKEGGKGVVYETDKRGNGVARKRGRGRHLEDRRRGVARGNVTVATFPPSAGGEKLNRCC